MSRLRFVRTENATAELLKKNTPGNPEFNIKRPRSGDPKAAKPADAVFMHNLSHLVPDPTRIDSESSPLDRIYFGQNLDTQARSIRTSRRAASARRDRGLRKEDLTSPVISMGGGAPVPVKTKDGWSTVDTKDVNSEVKLPDAIDATKTKPEEITKTSDNHKDKLLRLKSKLADLKKRIIGIMKMHDDRSITTASGTLPTVVEHLLSLQALHEALLAE